MDGGQWSVVGCRSSICDARAAALMCAMKPGSATALPNTDDRFSLVQREPDLLRQFRERERLLQVAAPVEGEPQGGILRLRVARHEHDAGLGAAGREAT